ncbi:hypothetical protein WME90_45360 [Sorangium sp. So ce375]|uniref:hypothetical protein n=1 Tax=Sorangium sp. So ce375 TaxID=3133306 RepID=UPI003F5C2669
MARGSTRRGRLAGAETTNNPKELTMKHLFFAAFLLPVAHVGAADPATPGSSEGAVVEAAAEIHTEVMPLAAPICLPGEKLVCTLGPPPRCRCE